MTPSGECPRGFEVATPCVLQEASPEGGRSHFVLPRYLEGFLSPSGHHLAFPYICLLLNLCPSFVSMGPRDLGTNSLFVPSALREPKPPGGDE